MRTAEQYEAMSPQELWNLSVAELETAFSYGNKTAATLLGQAYARGAKGVQQDGRKAVFYLEKSCMVPGKTGSVACYYMGICYQEILELKDIQKAIFYFDKAAENGYTAAMISLAKIYWNAKGVKRDAKKAVKYLLKAEQMGCTETFMYFALGQVYLTGVREEQMHIYVKQDVSKAVDYLEKAHFYTKLGSIYTDEKYQSIVGYNINKAMHYYELARKEGDVDGAYHLMRLYLGNDYAETSLRNEEKGFAMAREVLRQNKSPEMKKEVQEVLKNYAENYHSQIVKNWKSLSGLQIMDTIEEAKKNPYQEAAQQMIKMDKTSIPPNFTKSEEISRKEKEIIQKNEVKANQQIQDMKKETIKKHNGCGTGIVIAVILTILIAIFSGSFWTGFIGSFIVFLPIFSIIFGTIGSASDKINYYRETKQVAKNEKSIQSQFENETKREIKSYKEQVDAKCQQLLNNPETIMPAADHTMMMLQRMVSHEGSVADKNIVAELRYVVRNDRIQYYYQSTYANAQDDFVFLMNALKNLKTDIECEAVAQTIARLVSKKMKLSCPPNSMKITITYDGSEIVLHYSGFNKNYRPPKDIF